MKKKFIRACDSLTNTLFWTYSANVVGAFKAALYALKNIYDVALERKCFEEASYIKRTLLAVREEVKNSSKFGCKNIVNDVVKGVS